MKKRALILTSMATACFAMAAQADIVGSAHDFSPFGWSDGEICKPCHTPHHADTSVEKAPLWNHELTTATYTLYDGTAGDTSDLDGRTVLCMSCHDGTVALDSFGGNTGSQEIGSAGLLGTDMQDDHPVGRLGEYPDVPWFNDPANWENTAGHGFALQDMLDENGDPIRVVSCTTCHEPHNRNGNEHMLWKSNAGSDLCLTCHLK